MQDKMIKSNGQRDENKALGYFLAIISFTLIVGYFFVFIGHVDFFATKKSTVGRIIKQSESKNGDGIYICLQFYNDYKNDTDTLNKYCKYSTIRSLFKNNVQGYTRILYTRWEKQVFLEGYGQPARTIFILDFIAFVLLWLGIKAGISRVSPPKGKE